MCASPVLLRRARSSSRATRLFRSSPHCPANRSAHARSTASRARSQPKDCSPRGGTNATRSRAEFGAPPWFLLERAAARYFGVRTYAVHINGLVRRGDETLMWIARRSPTKAIDPGLLDNLVGGGIAHGQSIASTVVKEAWEEAGIPPDTAVTASPAGEVHVCRELADGLERETIFVYDILLADDFTPACQDGEAVEHRLVALRRCRRAHRERNRARRRHRQCKSRDTSIASCGTARSHRMRPCALHWKRCGSRRRVPRARSTLDVEARRSGIPPEPNATARRRQWLTP